MISRKNIGLIAVVTPFWFLAVYLIMSSRRPEYSHLTKAISELGSLDAPNRWFWNILGYILPGLAIALLGVGLKRDFAPAGRRASIPSHALVASGLLMAMSGVFPGDFENRASTTMILHTVASLGSFAAFLVAGFGLPKLFRSRESWRWVAVPSLALVVASIVTGLLRSGAAPGLGQRLGFACVFLWIGLVGCALIRSNSAENDA
jgi:hypothetical membrane protein